MNFKFEAFFEVLSVHVTAHGPAGLPGPCGEKSAARSSAIFCFLSTSTLLCKSYYWLLLLVYF